MRSPAKPKDTLSKVIPLRWSFGSKDRIKHSGPPQSGELVEYLESGRRPRCTKDPIVALVATPPLRDTRGRVVEVGQDCSSPSGSSLSCTERLGSDTSYSPKRPEGQSRPCLERNLSHGSGTGSRIKFRDDDFLRQGLSKKLRTDQIRALDFQLQSGGILGGHISYSAPPSRDSTLKRTKVQTGGTYRCQKDLLQMGVQSEDRKEQRGEEAQSQDGLVSILKPGFVKKDIPRSPVKEPDRRTNLGKLANSHLAKFSFSNGTLPAVQQEDKRGCIIPSCDPQNCKTLLVNGKAGTLEPVDIKRALSSSNIETKLDVTFRRCASLQRNGDVVVPASHRVLLSDKTGCSTLQRTRYSTTSLGRYRRVPVFDCSCDQPSDMHTVGVSINSCLYLQVQAEAASCSNNLTACHVM